MGWSTTRCFKWLRSQRAQFINLVLHLVLETAKHNSLKEYDLAGRNSLTSLFRGWNPAAFGDDRSN